MQSFTERTTTIDGHKVYDLPMPANAETYGDSRVADPDGKVHVQVTHSKVWIYDADDPSKPLEVTIVTGNGGKTDPASTEAGVIEYVVPLRGLCSVEAPAGRNLCVFGDVFPVWVN